MRFIGDGIEESSHLGELIGRAVDEGAAFHRYAHKHGGEIEALKDCTDDQHLGLAGFGAVGAFTGCHLLVTHVQLCQRAKDRAVKVIGLQVVDAALQDDWQLALASGSPVELKAGILRVMVTTIAGWGKPRQYDVGGGAFGHWHEPLYGQIEEAAG
ncbi:hypothetical protein Ahp2_38 [Aeromonas phage Ahp2]|nr:hypothetical protein Ahp2_38 [Aeromonas phage Ahp2]